MLLSIPTDLWKALSSLSEEEGDPLGGQGEQMLGAGKIWAAPESSTNTNQFPPDLCVPSPSLHCSAPSQKYYCIESRTRQGTEVPWLQHREDRFALQALPPGKNVPFSLITDNTWNNRRSARHGRDCKSPLTGTLHQWQVMKRRKHNHCGPTARELKAWETSGTHIIHKDWEQCVKASKNWSD